jgi:hypothetical protein
MGLASRQFGVHGSLASAGRGPASVDAAREAMRVMAVGAACGGARAPEPGGGPLCRARGAHERTATRPGSGHGQVGSTPQPVVGREPVPGQEPVVGREPVVGQRIATGATGVPVPPTNGSGIAESRNA